MGNKNRNNDGRPWNNQGGNQGNQGNQGGQPPANQGQGDGNNTATKTEPTAEQQLSKAIKWLGSQIVSVRVWVSRRDNRTYATAKTTGKSPNEFYDTPADLARDILEAHRNENAFVTYRLRFNNETKVGRLIAVDKNNNLTFALESEYSASAGGAEVEQFQKRDDSAVADGGTTSASNNQDDAGFGNLF